MVYENDPYRDEDGEPLMDFDEEVPADEDDTQQNIQDDDWDNASRRERSPTPVYNESNPKPRKRLIKKSSSSKGVGPVDYGLDDDVDGVDYGVGEDDIATLVRDDYSKSGKRKVDRGGKGKEVERRRKDERGDKKLKVRKSGSGGRMRNHEADPEMKEMWDTVAGVNSEDDHEGTRNADDDNFIDDDGVEPAEGYGSDNAHSPSRAPQVLILII